MTTITVEPLSWDVYDFWFASMLPVHCVREAPIVVARNDDHKVVAFAALAAESVGCAVIAPFICDSFIVGVPVMDKLEGVLWDAGIRSYYLWTDKNTPASWVGAIERSGLAEHAGSAGGRTWYRRQLQAVRELH